MVKRKVVLVMTIIKNNIIYDQQKQLATDIYFPNNTDSNTKILIFWHGGGWFRGSKDALKSIGVSLANAGFMTFIPDYSLAPKNIFPAAHKDAENFVNWLLASDYTDPDDHKNIVQIGASVGGTLAIYLAGKFAFPTVTWSAPVEFSSWMEKHYHVKPSPIAQEEFGLTDRHDINDSFYKYFTLTYTGTADHEVLTKLDARSYDLDQLSSLLMINSADELTPLNSVLDFIDHLAKMDKESQLMVIKGHRHAMDYGKEYLDESIDFLHQIIKRQK